MSNILTPEEALDEYRRNQHVKAQQAKEAAKLEEARKREKRRQQEEDDEKRRHERKETLTLLWRTYNPAGRYIDACVDAIENDEKIQTQLLEHMKSTGSASIYFARYRWPVGQQICFIYPHDLYKNGEGEAMDHQLCYDRNLVKSRAIKRGPFAGWTFTTKASWFLDDCWSAQLSDKRWFFIRWWEKRIN